MAARTPDPVPRITPGNGWAAAQGRFVGLYRRRREALPETRMWMRAWVGETPSPTRHATDWVPFVWQLRRLPELRRWVRALVGVVESGPAVGLYPVGAAAGDPPVLVVETDQEGNLDPDDMIEVTVVGTVAPSGHLVIDAGAYGDLTPSTNPRLPRAEAPGA